jgi:hypothetical protein
MSTKFGAKLNQYWRKRRVQGLQIFVYRHSRRSNHIFRDYAWISGDSEVRFPKDRSCEQANSQVIPPRLQQRIVTKVHCVPVLGFAHRSQKWRNATRTDVNAISHAALSALRSYASQRATNSATATARFSNRLASLIPNSPTHANHHQPATRRQ